MNRVSREQFVSFIEAGIAASPDLTVPERIALRAVALTAARADSNYAMPCDDGKLNVGCPASQAKLPLNPSDFYRTRLFANGYDTAVSEAGFLSHQSVGVV